MVSEVTKTRRLNSLWIVLKRRCGGHGLWCRAGTADAPTQHLQSCAAILNTVMGPVFGVGCGDVWLAAGELQPAVYTATVKCVLKSLKMSSGLPWSFTVVTFEPRLSTAALALVHLVTI